MGCGRVLLRNEARLQRRRGNAGEFGLLRRHVAACRLPPQQRVVERIEQLLHRRHCRRGVSLLREILVRVESTTTTTTAAAMHCRLRCCGLAQLNLHRTTDGRFERIAHRPGI